MWCLWEKWLSHWKRGESCECGVKKKKMMMMILMMMIMAMTMKTKKKSKEEEEWEGSVDWMLCAEKPLTQQKTQALSFQTEHLQTHI